MLQKSKITSKCIGLIIITALAFTVFPYFRVTQAVQLTQAQDTLSCSSCTNGPEAVSQTSVSHTIQYTNQGASLAPGATITLYIQTSGSGFSGFGANTITVTDTTTSQTLFSGSVTPTSVAAGTVTTFPTTAFEEFAITPTATNTAAVGDVIKITGITATNPSIASTNTAPFVIDIQDSNTNEGYLAIPIVNPGTAVSVQGIVTPYLTLAITGTSINYGVFSTGINTAATQSVLTLNTNATNGVTISAYDTGSGSSPGLYSSGSGHLIAEVPNTGAATTLSTSVEQTGMQGTGASGMSMQAPFNGATSTDVGGVLTSGSTVVAKSSGPLASGTVTMNYSTSILPTTQAGLYKDTVTYVAVGSF